MPKPILTPAGAVADLRREVSHAGYKLSQSVLRAFDAGERWVHDRDMCVFPEMFLIGLLQESESVRTAISSLGFDPDVTLLAARRLYHIDSGAAFRDSGRYSDRRRRQNSARGEILDLALASAEAEGRQVVADGDLLSAILQKHEQEFPLTDNESWPERELRTPYLTLAHMIMRYDRALDVKFDDLRKALYLPARPVAPWSSVPNALATYMATFRRDHPDYRRNVFVIMSFAKTRLHKLFYEAVKKALASHGFVALRADEHAYSEDLTTNILTYMHGCNCAIAVFERVENDTYNANVSFEIGYLTALQKPVCLLKERTVPRLPSDLIGRIYSEFDAQRVTDSVRVQIERWLRGHRMI